MFFTKSCLFSWTHVVSLVVGEFFFAFLLLFWSLPHHACTNCLNCNNRLIGFEQKVIFLWKSKMLIVIAWNCRSSERNYILIFLWKRKSLFLILLKKFQVIVWSFLCQRRNWLVLCFWLNWRIQTEKSYKVSKKYFLTSLYWGFLRVRQLW